MPDGEPAYSARYRRTFGFYEGRASVVTDAGWAHITADGELLTKRRWAWAGNFQGGRCAVRDAGGRYGHLCLDGGPAYAPEFRYAGDFRDGIAVAQRDDGYSTHINVAGEEVHGHWFVDLDVFHKGFARARGEDGWMHVDALGHPIYRRRFAAVEPFYNGQARVERNDGALEVIDETGETVVELRPARRTALHVVSGELVSFWRCEAVYAAVKAGLFERLPIADRVAKESERRLLGALGELGLVARDSESWRATDAGALLHREHPQSLVPAAEYWAMDGRRDWAALPQALATTGWHPPDPFAAAAADPARVRALQAALAPYAVHDYRDAGQLIDPGRTLIDAGGGSGALSEAVLRAWPEARAIVLDRPEVARLGRVPADLADRLRFEGADLFGAWPVRGDAVVLARVLHDWPDDEALRLLRRAREAVGEGGWLYVVELVQSPDGFRGGLLSLHLILSTGGRERTSDEFRELLWRSGWEHRDTRRLGPVVDVLVARAA